MQRHISLLAVLTALEGGLSLLVGVSTLILAVGALVELSRPSDGLGLTVAASVAASALTLFSAFALAWGVAHLWVAAQLKRRRPAGRVAMLALGVCNLPLVPFGSVLGGYALWVLGSSTARPFFDGPPPSALP